MLQKARHSGRRHHVVVINDTYTIKLGPKVREYEYRILKLLDRLETIPTPRPFAFFTIQDANVIVMSTIPGSALHHCQRLYIGTKYYRRVLKDAKRIMEKMNVELRKLEGLDEDMLRCLQRGCFGELDGKRCMEFPRYDGFVDGMVGLYEFTDVMSANAVQTPELMSLQRSCLDCLSDATFNTKPRPAGKSSLDTSSKSTLSPTMTSTPDTLPVRGTALDSLMGEGLTFCHLDLSPGNIMIKDGKISGIIDWEFAGESTTFLRTLTCTSPPVPCPLTLTFAENIHYQAGTPRHSRLSRQYRRSRRLGGRFSRIMLGFGW